MRDNVDKMFRINGKYIRKCTVNIQDNGRSFCNILMQEDKDRNMQNGTNQPIEKMETLRNMLSKY